MYNVALIFMSLFLALSVSYEVKAHSWYDYECCSGRDCMKADSMFFTQDGDMVLSVKEHNILIPRTMKKRPSQDGDFHVCLKPDFTARCVYVPAGV